MSKLLCFLTDPLKTYLEKGEIKERYYNPCNVFSEVNFITRNDTDVNYEAISTAVGNAYGNIFSINKETYWPFDNNPLFPPYQNNIFKIIEKYKPDVIRAYDPIIGGFLAIQAGKKYNIPVIISVHTDMDDIRKHYRFIYNNYKKYLISLLVSRPMEKFVLTNASYVIGAYEFAANYARRYGAKNVKVIYNRVPIGRYCPKPNNQGFNKPRLIYVGNFIPGKNQQTLIKAMSKIDGHLLLIGRGPEQKKCKDLVRKLMLEGEVTFIDSVPNVQLHDYYQSSSIFVSAATYGGIAIPALESMACGLPCVIALSGFSGPPELVQNIASIPNNDPESIAAAVKTVLKNPELRKEMSVKGRSLMEKLSGTAMEQLEAEVYSDVLNKKVVVR